MALTSNENAPPQTRAANGVSGRIAGFAQRFWLGRLWLRKAWLRRSVLSVLGLFVVLVLFAIFALPPIVIAQAERAVEQKLHRRLTIEKVQVHPFTLIASVQGVRLYEPDRATVFASLEQLETRLSPASLVYLAPLGARSAPGSPLCALGAYGAKSL